MAPSSQIVEFVAFAEFIASGPYYYSQSWNRCDPIRSGYADCSGLVVAAARHAGANVECTGSFQIARWCHEANTGLSYDVARATRGALVFIGTHEGQGGRPGIDPGHIAISRGDGTTVEARNRRAGILYGPFDGRGWDYAALPPWFPATMFGAPPDEPTQPQEVEEDDDMVIVVTDGKPAMLISGGKACLIRDGQTVLRMAEAKVGVANHISAHDYNSFLEAFNAHR